MGRSRRAHSPAGVPEIDGYVVIDKPAGMTSHDVVARARRDLLCRRIGHAGTLDPGATGVLVLGVGRATRLLRYVSDLGKSYAGEFVFGSTTTTLDDEGEVVAEFDMTQLEFSRVEEGAERFVGTIEQTPPMVSAVKIDGTRLYELARQGIEVERRARTVTISRLDLFPTDDPTIVRFEVDCSSGTYVRALAADLGTALGGGAHLRGLRRVSIGPFLVENAVALEQLSRELVRPSAGLVAHLGSVVVDDAHIREIAHGTVMERRALKVVGEGPFALLRADGQLLAVYESWTTERIKPSVVLIEPGDADAMSDDRTLDEEAPLVSLPTNVERDSR